MCDQVMCDDLEDAGNALHDDGGWCIHTVVCNRRSDVSAQSDVERHFEQADLEVQSCILLLHHV